MEPANWEPDATARTFLPYRQGGGAAGNSLVNWRAYPYGRIWPVAERGTSPYPILRSLHRYDRLVPSVTPTWGAGCWGVDNRYRYNGKELNEDLGLYDYGARWYNPAIARFTSIDRFAAKYSFQTPYAYAANDPIKYIDVNGDSIWISHRGANYLYQNGALHNSDGTAYTGKVKGFLKRTVNALGTISGSTEGAAMIAELEGSNNNFTIMHSSNNPNKSSEFKADDIGGAYSNQLQNDPNATGASRAKTGGSGGTIYWDPSGSSLPTTSGVRTDAQMDLGHEMFHGLDSNRGLLDDRLDSGIERSEWQATYRENTVRSQLNKPLRTHYLKTADPSGNVLGGTGARMLTPANKPLLPKWYKE